MTRLPRRFHACTTGAAAVEFAIISTVLIGLCIATVDFGRTFYTRHQISALADQAVRKVLIDPDVSSAALAAELRADFSAGNAGDLTVSISSETAGGMSFRVVTVGYPMTLFIPGLNSDAVSLSVTRRVPEG